MNRRPYWMKFLAPDDGAPAGGGGTAAPEAASAAPAASPAVDASAATSLLPETTRSSVVISARKGLGLPESPKKAVDEMAKNLQTKVNATNTPLTPKKVVVPIEQPTDTTETKPEAEKPAATPAAPAKIKVGDKEFTQAELEKHIADLTKKPEPEPAKPAEKPAEGAKPEDKAAKDAAAADLKKRDDAFLTTASKTYSMTDEELDVLLSGGPKAVEFLGLQLAKAELNTRKWMEETLNPILADLQNRIEPMSVREQQIRDYQAHQDFAANYQDLAPHTKIVQDVRTALQNKYPAQFAAMTPAEQNQEIASNARKMIADYGIQAAAPAAAEAAAVVPVPTPAPVVIPPRPQPPKGQAPTTTAPQRVNTQKAMAADIIAHS